MMLYRFICIFGMGLQLFGLICLVLLVSFVIIYYRTSLINI